MCALIALPPLGLRRNGSLITRRNYLAACDYADVPERILCLSSSVFLCRLRYSAIFTAVEISRLAKGISVSIMNAIGKEFAGYIFNALHCYEINCDIFGVAKLIFFKERLNAVTLTLQTYKNTDGNLYTTTCPVLKKDIALRFSRFIKT